MPPSNDHQAARFGGPPTVLFELLRRRAMPAAVGGCAAAAMVLARPRAADGRMPHAVHPRPCGRVVVQLLAAISAIVLALLIAPSAHAEEIFTGQATAAHATDSTWIPAPAQRAAVCVVDTGNDVSPDTVNVLDRLSVDSGDGADRNSDHHGTLMAMIASAPYNGFGMVGAAPSINVVSVRASREGASFGGTDLGLAIQKCITNRNIYNIKVISMSLGGAMIANLDAAAMALVQNNVANARRAGLNVVAAAGNHPGAIDWPAAYGPVLAVGAADNTGARCSFAASGPELDLWASGCPVDAARPDGTAVWASGSSESTAFVAGVLTQLRGLRPDLTVDAAEQLLTQNTRATDAGPSLDVDAALRAAGLGAELTAGHAAIPVLGTQPSTQEATSNTTTTVTAPAAPDVPVTTTPAVVPKPVAVAARPPARLSKPAVSSVRYRRGLLTFTFKNKPKGIQARVEIFARQKGRAFPTLTRNLRVTGDRLRTRVSGTLSEVSITYRDPTGVRGTSALLSLHPRK
ncbi:MAG TPA: S8 family serine peptidase [Baekduia sp.]|uniref:S8 family peptidase n=1 Tax=Baekduia sp. TaxID=2600305 RepID=UPI002BE1FB1D|nr:S8 family serine peptidase [Baekduia sp.]HMJ34797.1 S8 family serine peptidase [Baekduia sp.]